MTSESSVAGHTPGPWEIRHRLNSAGLPNRGGRYVILQKGSSLREDFFICEMPFAACRGQDEIEHEANARLIAAAPELLEFAKWVADRGGDNNCMDIFKRASSLIAKAEGGAA